VATGASKAPLMAHMLGLETRSPPLPAAEVKPTNGVVAWYIDQDAASPEVLGAADTCSATGTKL
jgi:6-phosphogluconolactonase